MKDSVFVALLHWHLQPFGLSCEYAGNPGQHLVGKLSNPERFRLRNDRRRMEVYYQPGTTTPPIPGKQRSWDGVIFKQVADQLLSNASTNEDKARLLEVRQPNAGDWLLAPLITSVGLKMSNEEIRLAVGLRLRCNLCEPHILAANW